MSDASPLRIALLGAGGRGRAVLITRRVDAAIKRGQQPQPDMRAGRMAVALCEAIDRSVELGEPVQTSEIPSPA